MSATKEFRVSIDVVEGPDFYVRFERDSAGAELAPLSEDQYKAAAAFILKAHQDGFVTNAGQIIPVSRVKEMKVVEYEILSAPNPAGAGSRVAVSYGNGIAAVRRAFKDKAEAALPLDRNGR